jgi:hypothetical protein
VTGGVSGVLCVYGAVATAISAAGSLWAGYKGAGTIWQTLSGNGGFFKRDVAVADSILDELSTLFGGKVTHLGHWNYAPPSENDGPEKREAGSLRHVFGLSGNGLDIHFAYLGNITNKHTFRIGLGPGAGSKNMNSTSSSTSQNRARQVNIPQQFDDQFFQDGGLDINLVENPDNYSYADGGLDANGDYQWIYTQVSCLMNDQFASVGQFFQIYDEYHKNTLAAGTVAPFLTSGGSSAIREMGDPHGGLQVNSFCTRPNQK